VLFIYHIPFIWLLALEEAEKEEEKATGIIVRVMFVCIDIFILNLLVLGLFKKSYIDHANFIEINRCIMLMRISNTASCILVAIFPSKL
jgi:hypothetical protein